MRWRQTMKMIIPKDCSSIRPKHITTQAAPQPSTNFDRTIEKMQKAIQLHSIKKKPKKKRGKSRDKKYKEWMQREEYNPFLHNAWLMMGQAQYMNGDFPWLGIHISLHNDAFQMAARSCD